MSGIQVFLLRRDSEGNVRHSYTGIQAESHEQLFNDWDKLLLKIPPSERWNVYCTIAEHITGQRSYKSFRRQNILPLDCDGIDHARADDYEDVVANFLEIPTDSFTTLNSGNGLHFYIKLAYDITSVTELKSLQLDYSACLHHLTSALKARGLPGKFDMILDAGRVLRLPDTINRKPEKGPDGKPTGRILEKRVTSRQTAWGVHMLDLRRLSGLPPVTSADQLHKPGEDAEYGEPDAKAILSECAFMRWATDCPTEVKEPQGYAALSILALLDSDRTLAKKTYTTWTNSTSLQSGDPDSKIEQACNRSGPRTCESIGKIWAGCQACKLRGTIRSPISIKSTTHIGSESKGFWLRKNGTLVPQYDDLLRAFSRDHHYRYQSKGKVIWAYTGTHYREYDEAEVKSYCESMMIPKPLEKHRAEFLAKLRANQVSNLKSTEEFFTQSIHMKVNMRNGVLDLKTRTLLPHSPQYGFRYCLPYDYTPGATAPRFQRMCQELMLQRQEFVDVILDIFAACLVPGYKQFEAGFWWWQGTGRNGKSILRELLQEFLGEGNSVVMSPDSLTGEASRFRLADMDGKLACIIEETNEEHLGSRMLGLVKNITSGGIVAVERKGKDPYQMTATAKLIFTANKPPVLEDTTPAIRRRFIVLPFDLNFDDADCPLSREPKPQLQATLTSELPGIFNLALGALDKLMHRYEFLMPDASKQILSDIIDDSDSFERWFKNSVTITGNDYDRCKLGELYDHYTKFVDDKNVATKRTITQKMRTKNKTWGATKKINFHGDTTWGYVGVKLHGLKADY